jgi:hypothetical protein
MDVIKKLLSICKAPDPKAVHQVDGTQFIPSVSPFFDLEDASSDDQERIIYKTIRPCKYKFHRKATMLVPQNLQATSSTVQRSINSGMDISDNSDIESMSKKMVDGVNSITDQQMSISEASSPPVKQTKIKRMTKAPKYKAIRKAKLTTTINDQPVNVDQPVIENESFEPDYLNDFDVVHNHKKVLERAVLITNDFKFGYDRITSSVLTLPDGKTHWTMLDLLGLLNHLPENFFLRTPRRDKANMITFSVGAECKVADRDEIIKERVFSVIIKLKTFEIQVRFQTENPTVTNRTREEGFIQSYLSGKDIKNGQILIILLKKRRLIFQAFGQNFLKTKIHYHHSYFINIKIHFSKVFFNFS